MTTLGFIAANIVETLLRLFPFPARTGLTRIGNPDKNSPVLITCNFHLTVTRIKKILKGMDAYLLVANSRGINVWCAATGGLFTNHDIISVLKTSGIEDMVDHRNVILPQLAAAGIEARQVQKKTGWKVIWGPVYANDIQRFMKDGQKKDPEMRKVDFRILQRLEMAVAWAFPVSAILALILIPFWREAILPLVLLVWGLSLFLFIAFPLYGHRLDSKGQRIGFVFFDFGRGGFQLIVWCLLMVGLLAYGILANDISLGFILRWGIVSFVIVLVLSFDLMGSTPVYKSGLHGDRFFKIAIDEEKCKGATLCEQVCPRNCYEIDASRHVATIPGAGGCVQCGACIIQCPFDALSFMTPKGERILPETIRKFKLNLMGKRAVETKQE